MTGILQKCLAFFLYGGKNKIRVSSPSGISADFQLPRSQGGRRPIRVVKHSMSRETPVSFRNIHLMDKRYHKRFGGGFITVP